MWLRRLWHRLFGIPVSAIDQYDDLSVIVVDDGVSKLVKENKWAYHPKRKIVRYTCARCKGPLGACGPALEIRPGTYAGKNHTSPKRRVTSFDWLDGRYDPSRIRGRSRRKREERRANTLARQESDAAWLEEHASGDAVAV